MLEMVLSTSADSDAEATQLPDFSFLVFGDPQYTDGSNRGEPRQFQLRDSIRFAKSQYPELEFAITVGDYGETKVAEGATDQYEELNGFFGELESDVYGVLGNHDVSLPSKNTPGDISLFYSRANVLKDFDSLGTRGYGYEKRDNGLHLILLDATEAMNQGAAGGGSATGHFYYSSDQIAWLKDTLDSITETRARIVVVTHAALRAGAYPPNSIVREFQHEQTQATLVLTMLVDWQADSDRGLVLGVFGGHSHIDAFATFETENGAVDNIIFDELDGVPSGYPGDADTINADPQWMAFAHVRWSEAGKVLRITGYGEQDSYLLDYSDRITEPQA